MFLQLVLFLHLFLFSGMKVNIRFICQDGITSDSLNEPRVDIRDH